MTESINDVIALKKKYQAHWRTRSQWYWAWRMFQEFCELIFALAGLHRHSPDLELKQISSIGLNWLEYREQLRAKGLIE